MMEEQSSCCQMGGKKFIIVLLAILAITGVCVVSILRDRIVNQNQWTVSTTGQGKISYKPDVANINLGVQVDKKAKAEDALSELNDKVNKIVDAVKALGITEDKFSNTNYTLTSQYDYVEGIQILSGYSANQQIIIKVENVDENQELLEKVISEAAKAGVNQINSVSFDYSDIDKIKQQAKVMAISDAKTKAGEIASAAGVKLGKIVGWWDNVIKAPGINNYYYYGGYGEGMGGGGSGMPNVPTGEQEVIVEVSLTYKVK